MATTIEAPPVPRFKQRYREEIRPQLSRELGLNVMATPGLEKISVNMGVGDVLRDGKALE
ncbi:MAG: 50S ribosomal protein L5, partial [Actinomycetota bacterium]